MKARSTIVLPGLDGNCRLLEPFVSSAPEHHSVRIIPLPDDPEDDYNSLSDKLKPTISELGSCHLVAESFSGPLAILLAHRLPKVIQRLSLVATFATSPRPLALRFTPWSILFRFPMPTWVARHYFVGPDASLIRTLKRSVQQTSPQTLAKRIRCVASIDVTPQLSELACETLYLRPNQDRLVPIRSMHTITSANRAVEVREIDGPHLILQTQPKRAWEAILK